MTTTPNLLLTHIVASQSQKEVTANAAFDGLDDALCNPTVIAMADANLTLTDAQMLGNMYLSFTGTLTAARTITVPVHAKLILIENDTTGGFALNVKVSGGTPLTFNAGDLRLLYCDGTNLKAVTTPATVVVNPYDIGMFVAGKPLGSAIAAKFIATRAIVLPINLTGSEASAEAASTGNVSFTIYVNNVSKGSVNFNTSATGTFTFSSAVTLAIGDVVKLTAPGTQDATLTDIAITLTGTR